MYVFPAISLLLIIICLFVAGFFLVESGRELFGESFDVSGRHDLEFFVYYVENDFWDENPIPRNLNFLMSHTDFIRVRSEFSLNMSEEAEIIYSYTATERLIIRYMAGGDAGNTVFENVTTLSEQRGRRVASSLRFSAGDESTPGGMYIFDPLPHIHTYFDFVSHQTAQMHDRGLVALGLRGFSAELQIDFVYTIAIPTFGVNENISRGYRIQLTSEVFTPVLTGGHMFDVSVPTYVPVARSISMPMTVLLVAFFALGVYGLVRNIGLFSQDPNPRRREVNAILKKYSGEIVVDDAPVDLSRFYVKRLKDFSELLKLAVNLSKHIMCYNNRKYAEFVVIVDEFAYVYRVEIKNGKNGSSTPPEPPVPEEAYTSNSSNSL
jgi:hypothetical protein